MGILNLVDCDWLQKRDNLPASLFVAKIINGYDPLEFWISLSLSGDSVFMVSQGHDQVRSVPVIGLSLINWEHKLVHGLLNCLDVLSISSSLGRGLADLETVQADHVCKV